MDMNTGRYKAKALIYGSNSEWVEGLYVNQLFITPPLNRDECHFIYSHHTFGDVTETQKVHINPETLCQCTGLKDSQGKLIFEGDILGDRTTEEGGSRWGAVVVWKDGAWRVKLERGTKSTYLLTEWLAMRKQARTPEFVVGNIHDPNQ